MTEAVWWGAVAAGSLVLGGILGVVRPWPARWVGLVLAFGAGALVSAVSFDLAQEGGQRGGFGHVAIGLAAGALTYFLLDRLVDRPTSRPATTGAAPGPAGSDDATASGTPSSGGALALGALLDGIPEQIVLGIGVAAGEGVRLSLLVAIFVSNLPEAIGGSTDLRAAGHRPAAIIRVWLAVTVVCVAAAAAGYAIADETSGAMLATIDGFAAGSLLVMLIDSMIPEATRQGGRAAGLFTVLGFAVAAALSGIA